jgi:hypothetical protein
MAWLLRTWDLGSRDGVQDLFRKVEVPRSRWVEWPRWEFKVGLGVRFDFGIGDG